LVRVHGAGVGGGEVVIRAGKIASVTGRQFPRGTGNDFAGEVAEVGIGVVGYKPGDRVWGIMPYGTFGSVAEFVSVPVARIAFAPKSLDLVEVASLPVVGTTAIRALRVEAALRSGERLLVRGASGGMGAVAIQLGKAIGAQVTGLANARNLDWVRSLGADHAFDYARTAPRDLGQFDVILDVVGTEMESYRRLLAPGGRMVGLSFDHDHLFLSLVYLLATSVYGSRRVRSFSNNPDQSTIAELTSLVDEGVIKPVVDRVWSMSEIADAHRALERGGVRGKYVIRLG
jgi:NADPH:quinone reductase-like Zn-dependent oxidoreductase